MKLVILGSYGYGPASDGHTICCMLPELGIVLDAGSGCFQVADYQQTDSIEIYLSHAHLDHIIGIEYLFGSFMKKEIAAASLEDREGDYESIMSKAGEHMSKVSVYSADSVLTEVKKRLGDWSPLKWQPLTNDHPLPGSGKLSYFPLQHTAECYGYRLDWPGRSLAYVTDTVADEDAEYVEHIRGVNVLLHDCYLPDTWAELATRTGHSHTSAVARVAAKANVGRLILIHRNSGGLDIQLDKAKALFADSMVGQDGMEIEF